MSHDSLDAVIAGYMLVVEAGDVPNRQELLDRHPEHAEALRAFFADLDRMDRVASPLRIADGLEATGAVEANGHTVLPTVRYFGDYELLEEIARGGMGIVYKARQVSLNRLVALKMILAGSFASSRDVQRFRSEAEAAANLDHPHIVPIYEVGEHEGQQYYSMKFVEGTSLARHPRSDPRREVEGMVSVIRAVHHAHQRGVLHRDLKPSNVLVDSQGTRLVTDFGLAKRLANADGSITETGQVLGTPKYMAPEQAAGRKDLTVAADVYSLGVILYERLTGQTPFTGDNALTVLRQARESEPPRPSSIRPGLDRDLETVVLKCLEKEPIRRYLSAEALADDLANWLAGRPISARPVGQAERLWRWCRRNPAVASLAATVALSLFAGIVISTLFAVRANDRAQSERRQRERADALALDAGIAAARSQALLAQDASDPSVKLLTLAEAFCQVPAQPEADDLRWAIGASLALAGQQFHRLLPPLEGHDQPETAYTLSPDGRTYTAAAPDGTVRLWDFRTGRLQVTLRGHRGHVGEILFSPDGRLVVTWAGDGGSIDGVRVPAEGGIWYDNAKLYLNNGDQNVRIWNAATGEPRVRIPLRATAYFGDQISPDGRRLLVGTLLCDSADGRRIADLSASAGNATSVQFSPDGLVLALQETGRSMLRRMEDHVGERGGLPQEDADRTTVVDASTGRRLYTLPSSNVRFSPVGGEIAAAKRDTVRIYESATGKAKAVFSLPALPDEPRIKNSRFFFDDRRGAVAFGGSRGSRFEIGRFFFDDHFVFVYFWEEGMAVFGRSTGRRLAWLDGCEGPVDFSPDVAYAFYGGDVFDGTTLRRLKPPEGHRFHPALKSRAKLGRVQILETNHSLWDLPTELRLGSALPRDTIGGRLTYYEQTDGLVVDGQDITWIDRQPLATDPAIVRLWTEVVTRKRLVSGKEAERLTEAEWERCRQRLLRLLPVAASPLLVSVARDKDHWLRQGLQPAVCRTFMVFDPSDPINPYAGKAAPDRELDPAARVAALDELITSRPSWWYLQERGKSFLQMKNRNAAARDFLAAGHLAGDWYWNNVPAILDGPDRDRLLLASRPEAFLRDVLKLGTEEAEVAMYNLASLRRDSKRLVELSLSVLSHRLIPKHDLEGAVRLVRDLSPRDRGEDIGMVGGFVPADFGAGLAGIALYRQARFVDALSELNRAEQRFLEPHAPFGVRTAVLSTLAMTHARLGHARDAREWLQRARDQAHSDNSEDSPFLREAEEVLLDPTFPDDPFAD
jgi:hypothetical protein